MRGINAVITSITLKNNDTVLTDCDRKYQLIYKLKFEYAESKPYIVCVPIQCGEKKITEQEIKMISN